MDLIKDGFNKNGYDMYGFDKNGLNKNGFNIYAYKPKSNKFTIYKRRLFEDQKGKDTLIYLFFCLKCILIIIQKN